MNNETEYRKEKEGDYYIVNQTNRGEESNRQVATYLVGIGKKPADVENALKGA